MNDLPPIPDFRPSPLLRGGHAQTLAAYLWPGAQHAYRATTHTVALDDGDRIVLHDDCPDEWTAGRRTLLMIHGLAGCHASGYMRRIAAKANSRGIRTFRMDMRACGAGFGLAQYPSHSGRTGDVNAALAAIAELCPGSPTALIGFSLGGNMVLNTVAQWDSSPAATVDSAIAVCPPVDLATCSRQLHQGTARPYDRYFLRLLLRRLEARRQRLPDAPHVRLDRPPRYLWEFDDQVTAPLCGFSGAEDYYRRTSPAPLLAAVRLPTLLVAAADDPLVPSATFAQFELSQAVELHVAQSGGHLGFIGRRGDDPDQRWLDWRIVERVMALDGGG